MSKRMAQERNEAFLERIMLLDVSNDGLRCRLLPVLDHASMKGVEIGEMPIKAATRNTQLARQHVSLQRLEALTCQRPQGELNPVSSRQAFVHQSTLQTVLTAAMGG